ncbi:L-serine ammonia-lyase [Conexibacter sp. S30A1]|uniref:L-serine ammonia-lyase n=1 Tax=Conexibacter sp. S30A1 TaxID=2937800 RepID=UPI00200EDA21|nr:L-serine ammonia-lyase [Conexibacter sp. S30A1]
MTVSVFELFSVGIGPSSSHTVGPMRAARRFTEALEHDHGLDAVARVRVELYGSLALTGHAHGTHTAVLMGLEGERPETIAVASVPARVETIERACQLALLGRHQIAFDPAADIVRRRGERRPEYSNALSFSAHDARGAQLASETFFSIGGGFILSEAELKAGPPPAPALPHPFHSAAELVAAAEIAELTIGELARANELALRSQEELQAGLALIWTTMQECVARGLTQEGELPGGLHVPRRAAKLHAQLAVCDRDEPLRQLEWVNLFALSVNEENAAGGRVVTAPTNGAAGVVPAVLHYYARFVPGADEEGVHRFLLAAAAIGSIVKENASISGADVGCQGEIGSACSMAAAGLCEVLGGTPRQVENAAEIAMEHNLGLTCDPIGGLVQVPCIERNAIAAVKAINACQLALRGDGSHYVSLDAVIRTMYATGKDMSDRYKETSLGGLAVNVVEC